MFVRFATTFVFIVAAAACSSGGSSTGIADLTCPPASTLTYASFGQDMIARKCMSCHDQESPRLGAQDQIRAAASQILELAVYTDEMPKDTSMSLSDRQLLGEWLACGAP